MKFLHLLILIMGAIFLLSFCSTDITATIKSRGKEETEVIT